MTGHFIPIDGFEAKSVADTMWINTEIWDDVLKAFPDNAFRKGAALSGKGTLLVSKWKDKASGEDRKQFKLRILEITSLA